VRRSATLMAFLIPAAACAAWTVHAGKDVNWDLLNYHYYLPFELLSGRLEQDFFAASAQSYLNPVGYIPFYLMVSSGWHSVIVSITLAVAHSLSLALLYLLGYRLFAHLSGRERVVFACLAAAMGAATAAYWATVGSSFLDPLLLPFMLGGLLLLLDEVPGAAVRSAIAGALFGAAAALKYSNAIFLVAAIPVALTVPGVAGRARLRAGLAYAAGAAATLAILAGPWLMLMYREFGNPVFPLLNAWFQSPNALPVNLVSERFAPRSWAAALSFPFRMVTLDRSLYAEMFAPDLRFAALVVAAMALPAMVVAQRAVSTGRLRSVDWRLFAFFGAGYALWLASSANARYGMVVLLLAGVCLVRLAERILPANAARVALGIVLAVQIATSIVASPSRWFISDQWSKRWLPYDTPDRARREPVLYLTLETLPMAVIAPFVHPASSFVNFRGQSSIAPESPALAALIERHRGKVRALGRALELNDGEPRADVVSAYDDTLARIGYRLDTRDCFTIAWKPDTEDPISRIANGLAQLAPTTETLSVVSCGLAPAARDAERAKRERRVSALFDKMEQSCPGVFHGQTAVTEPLGSGWSRYYVGLDARLEAIGGDVTLNRFRAGVRIDLGRLSDWERDGSFRPAACDGRQAYGGRL